MFITFSANILLDHDFTAKIGDCGTVRVGPQGSRTSTHTQTTIGTYPYMPREYIEDNQVSIKTDAYSLGVVCLIISLLVFVFPFITKSLYILCCRILNKSHKIL